MLLIARLRAIRELAADERRLATARDEATTEALVDMRETVLQALDAADRASAGNEHLERQFASIRRAIGTMTDTSTSTAPDQSVIDWRRDAAERLTGVVTAADPTRPLTVTARGKNALVDLISLVDELDRRAHSRGVTSAAVRSEYLADLKGIVSDLLELADNDVPAPLEQLTTRRPQLARIVWSTALASASDPRAALAAVLVGSNDPRRTLLQVDVLLELVTDDDVVAVVGALSSEEIGAAWSSTKALEAHHRRARDAVAVEVDRQTEEVMERIAAELDLPFQAIEAILFGYFRLRSILKEAGWGQVAPASGEVVSCRRS